MRHTLAVLLACSALAACATPDETPQATIAASQPSDAALTCDQITSQVDDMNARIKTASATAQASAKGTTDAVTNTSEVTPMDQIRLTHAKAEADQAKARADTLIALGKQKKCYKG